MWVWLGNGIFLLLALWTDMRAVGGEDAPQTYGVSESRAEGHRLTAGRRKDREGPGAAGQGARCRDANGRAHIHTRTRVSRLRLRTPTHPRAGSGIFEAARVWGRQEELPQDPRW